jgi:hypothetical protein
MYGMKKMETGSMKKKAVKKVAKKKMVKKTAKKSMPKGGMYGDM